jgi:hypothetical protein
MIKQNRQLAPRPEEFAPALLERSLPSCSAAPAVGASWFARIEDHIITAITIAVMLWLIAILMLD